MDDLVSSEGLVTLGALLCALSGVPGIALGRLPGVADRVAALLAVLGCAAEFAGAFLFLATGISRPLSAASPIPGAEFTLSVDALSALFLLPIALVSGLGAVYAVRYWPQARHPENARRMRFFYGILAGSLALLVCAGEGVTFLFAWEVMALSAYFVVATEDGDPEVLSAAWLYLATSHFATLCLFAMFALIHQATGTFGFAGLGGAGPGVGTGIFLLALLGFGTKAGVMPLHVWLPSAHAMAPSHVSALLSGVVIKVGIYGLVRITGLFPEPPLWWGVVLLSLGAVSGVLGVAYAIGQHDVKRLLAYHSIENIGIIVMGLGLAVGGRALGQPNWVVLGLGGALLHVWNHATFKSLLFLSAGSVIHAAGTRELDRLGGLAKPMPWTALFFLVGAVAICGLPPLNGFVSELLIYLGLFRTLGPAGGASWGLGAFAAVALALIGALAAACFVKVVGVVFLGSPRSPEAADAHEAPAAMLGPMAVLALCCFAIGLGPGLVAPALDQGVAGWGAASNSARPPLGDLVPFQWVTLGGALLLVLLAALGLFLRSRLRAGPVDASDTWGCGYVAPTARMQYTSSSFAEMIVGLFGWALRPRTEAPRIAAYFPTAASFHTETPDVVLDEAVVPASRSLARAFALSRLIQQGSIQAYLLYILAAVIVLLVVG